MSNKPLLIVMGEPQAFSQKFVQDLQENNKNKINFHFINRSFKLLNSG